MSVAEAENLDLLERWQAGERRAGLRFFDAFYPPVQRFFRNKVGVPACDDLVQQTFMAAARAPFAGRSKVKTWLLSIAWRKLADYFRAEERRRRIEAPAFTLQSVADLGRSPHTGLEVRAEARLLLEGLRRLPIAMQAALELHYWEALSASQISEALSLPVGTIKTRIRDGRLRLARELEQIAESQEVLRTTLDDLDGWAARVRAAVDDA